MDPEKAPAVEMGETDAEPITGGEALIWFVGAPVATVVCILVGFKFDLRVNQDEAALQNWVGFIFAKVAYLYALFSLLFSRYILFSSGVLTPVVREMAQVTAMGMFHAHREPDSVPCRHLVRRR